MQVIFVFRSPGGASGLVGRRDAPLPVTLGPWTYLGAINLTGSDPERIWLSSQEVLGFIEHQGHYLVGPGVLAEEAPIPGSAPVTG